MFKPTSRYADVDDASITVGTGDSARIVRYKRRRTLPSEPQGVTLLQHVVRRSDRLDNLAAAYLGAPVLFWKICDANLAMRPEDLTNDLALGTTLEIALEFK